MTDREQAICYLKSDLLLHMDMLESIRRGREALLYIDQNGVLLLDQPSGTYMVSTTCEDIAEKILPLIKNAALIECHQKFYAKELAEQSHLYIGPDCYQAVYCKEQRISQEWTGVEIKQLDNTFLSAVKDQYHMIQDDEYLLGRLESGVMYGAFLGKELAGFIGIHEEGSIGLLEVLPEYRRRGIGMALEAHMVNVMLDKGWTPFGQIIEGNAASFSLQKRLGFSIAEQPLFWMTSRPE